jgi:hypothetical protein
LQCTRRASVCPQHLLNELGLVTTKMKSSITTFESSEDSHEIIPYPFFPAVDEEYPCVGQQTYTLHFTVEWARVGEFEVVGGSAMLWALSDEAVFMLRTMTSDSKSLPDAMTAIPK